MHNTSTRNGGVGRGNPSGAPFKKNVATRRNPLKGFKNGQTLKLNNILADFNPDFYSFFILLLFPPPG